MCSWQIGMNNNNNNVNFIQNIEIYFPIIIVVRSKDLVTTCNVSVKINSICYHF